MYVRKIMFYSFFRLFIEAVSSRFGHVGALKCFEYKVLGQPIFRFWATSRLNIEGAFQIFGLYYNIGSFHYVKIEYVHKNTF